MADPYNIIGGVLASLCSNGFDVARLDATLEDGYSDLEYVCVAGGNEKFVIPTSQKGAEVHNALHEIRASMTRPGQDPWSRCTFKLFPDGKFKFDVEYDD